MIRAWNSLCSKRPRLSDENENRIYKRLRLCIDKPRAVVRSFASRITRKRPRLPDGCEKVSKLLMLLPFDMILCIANKLTIYHLFKFRRACNSTNTPKEFYTCFDLVSFDWGYTYDASLHLTRVLSFMHHNLVQINLEGTKLSESAIHKITGSVNEKNMPFLTSLDLGYCQEQSLYSRRRQAISVSSKFIELLPKSMTRLILTGIKIVVVSDYGNNSKAKVSLFKRFLVIEELKIDDSRVEVDDIECLAKSLKCLWIGGDNHFLGEFQYSQLCVLRVERQCEVTIH